MKLFRLAKLTAAAALASVLLSLAAPTAASALEPRMAPFYGGGALKVQCQTHTNFDTTWEEIGKIALPKNPLKAMLWMYKQYKGAALRTAHLHPFEAQISWPKVAGAESYVIRRPDGVEEAPKNAISSPLDDPNTIRHTFLPRGLDGTEMPEEWRVGGGYVHLTYFVFAVDYQGNRSHPAEVKITVTRSSDDSSLTPEELGIMAAPGSSCGHEAVAGVAPFVADPRVICRMSTPNEHPTMTFTWRQSLSWSQYDAQLQTSDGTVLENLSSTTDAGRLVVDQYLFPFFLYEDDLAAGNLTIAIRGLNVASGGWEIVGRSPISGSDYSSDQARCSGWNDAPVVGQPQPSCTTEAGKYLTNVAKLTWSPVPNAESYDVAVYTYGDNELHVLSSLSPTAGIFHIDAFHIKNLGIQESDLRMYATVIARNSDGSSSSEHSGPWITVNRPNLDDPTIGIECGSAPSAPHLLKCTTQPASGSTKATAALTWVKYSDHANYKVSLRTASGDVLIASGFAKALFSANASSLAPVAPHLSHLVTDPNGVAELVVYAENAKGIPSTRDRTVKVKLADPNVGLSGGVVCA